MKVKFILPIVIFLNLEYLIWASRLINGPLGYVLYASEWALFSLTVLFCICHWERRATKETLHKPEGRVDVFVTCYNEPISMVERTLAAAVAIDYDQKDVYLLDDGPRPELHTLAKKMGAQYLSRGQNTHAKAGNLNAALAKTHSPFILVLDADQIPKQNIIKRMLGHFQDHSSIAVVTTRQRFDVHEKDFNQDVMFYEHMQVGKHTDDCPTSTGSGVIYLRSAIEKIGGFSTWNLVEDLTTTYELNKVGYTSVYINEPLTIGLAPQDIQNIYKQRGTWAVDGLRLLFKKTPFLQRKLRVSQRFHYLEITLHYLIAALVVPTLLIIPIISLLTNIPAVLAGTEYLLYRAPSLISIIGFYWLVNNGHQSNKYWAGLWPVYLKAIFLALKPKKMPYLVTQKVEEQRRRIFLVLPQLFLLIAGLFAIPLSVYLYGLSNSTVNNSIWVILNVWWMSSIVCRGFTKKHRHQVTIHTVVKGTSHA